MKNKYIRFTSIALLAGLLLTLWYYNQGVWNTNSSEQLAASRLTQKSFLKKYYGVQKEKKTKLASQGHPDLFEQMHADIRKGASGRSYPKNYRQIELQKALKNSPARFAKTLANPWIERGPGNVSGRTRTIVVDLDADPLANTWFAGAVGGGIWKTSNAGQSWTNLTPAISNLAITSMDQSQSNPQVLYAGTGEGGFYNLDAIDGSGIWKSGDRGNSWSQLSSTAENSDFSNVFRLVVDPQDEDIVLVACQTASGSAILKTTDGGDNWLNVYTSNRRVQHIIANPQNFRTLYAAVNGEAVIRSKDSGESWSPVLSSFDPAPAAGRIELAISPSDTNVIYASLDQSSGTRHDLYKSGDGGDSWLRVDDVSGTNPAILGSQGWYDHTIAVHPFNENIVYVGGVRLYSIQINGQTRSTQLIVSQTIPHVDHHNLTLIPFNEQTGSFRIINGNDGGIWYSDNSGASWTHTLNGYNSSQFYGADKRPGLDEYAGGMQDNGTWQSPAGQSASASTDWLFKIGGDGYDVVFNGENADEWIGGFQYNGFYLATNNGTSFTFIGNQVESGNGPFVSTLANNRANPELVLTVGRQGVYRSDDFGRNWVLTAIPDEQWSFGSLLPIEQSLANPQIVWAGRIMNNPAAGTNRLQLSTDGGVTFNPVNAQYEVSSLPQITGIATHPTLDSSAYLLFSGAGSPKILMTSDLGQSWADISGFDDRGISNRGFPDVAVYSLLLLPHEESTIWAGTEIGLFESTDGGASWHYAQNGFPAVSIWQMKIADDQVVLATHGRGIWSVTLPEIPALPVVTLPPSLRRPFQQPAGGLILPFKLKQPYDSVLVYIDDQLISRFSTDLVGDTTISYPVLEENTILVYADAYVDGQVYPTSRYNAEVLPAYAAQASYSSSFNAGPQDFYGNGFSITTPAAFNNPAIHTPHPYGDETILTYQLAVPIEVAASDAFVRFNEIVLIEPGEAGTVFGDFEFWDYVVVEGSSDGVNWQTLLNGYDSRAQSVWQTRYNQGGDGEPALFIQREINLRNTFAAGEIIYIRFLLFADAAVNGWGWAIDDLEIQGGITAVNDIGQTADSYKLQQNYPNPFNPVTTISYQLAGNSAVDLSIYNLLGQKVATLVDKKQVAGSYEVQWNASGFASGLYVYKLVTDKGFESTKKLILLK